MTMINRYEAEEYITKIFREYKSALKNAKQYNEELNSETDSLFKDIKEFSILIESHNLKRNVYDRLNYEGIKQLFSYAKQLAKCYGLNSFNLVKDLEICNETNNSAEIMRQIQSLQKEMSDWQNKGGEISSRQFEIFMDLAGHYNNALIEEGKLSLSDYMNGGCITTSFEEAQDAVGDYQVNLHSGIDVVGGDLKSPFFMTAINGSETGSNGKIFSIN